MPPFNKVSAPTDIGRVTVEFETGKADAEIKTGRVSFDVLDVAGNILGTQSHELVQHMTAAQKTAIFNFITAIRTKAKNEVTAP